MASSDGEDEYILPLQDQRVFGAGIKRKRVQFVPSSEAPGYQQPSQTLGSSISTSYLDLVLSKQGPQSNGRLNDQLDDQKDSNEQQRCPTCSLPITSLPGSTPHAALLAHQLSLPHSHPPSALARDRKGLQLLEAQGWDPDSRLGLGAQGEGIRFPIKAKEKDDKLGIGATILKAKRGDLEVSRAAKEARERKKKEDDRGKKGKGWLKKMKKEESAKRNRLQEMFYASEDFDKYLGGGS